MLINYIIYSILETFNLVFDDEVKNEYFWTAFTFYQINFNDTALVFFLLDIFQANLTEHRSQAGINILTPK